MDDPLLSIAEELARQLQTQFPTLAIGAESYPITVEWTEDVGLALEDGRIANPYLRIVDYGETEELESGQPRGEYELLVVAQMKLPSAVTPAAFRRAASGLMASIVRYLRPIDETCELLAGGESFACIKTERKPAVDPDEWHEKRRFLSIVSSTWHIYR